MVSSSSSTKMKATKFSKIQRTLFKETSSNATRFVKRQETVFKKARELSILCGIEVCVICYGSDGELKIWPEDREKVKAMALRYVALSETKRRKGSVNLHEFLKEINNTKMNQKVKYPVWDSRFDSYSEDQVTELIQTLERKVTRFQHKLDVIVEGRRQGQRKIQEEMNMGNQELMMTTTMMNHHNHLQKQSNQFSMFMFNHGTGSITQIPVSASSSALNQLGQSLAPLPPDLMIYPHSDVATYSGSLGVHGSGINGFQNMNMNMLTYDNINNIIDEHGINGFGINNLFGRNNFDVNDHSGLLGMQETGTNELHTNYYFNSVNANGLLHQPV